LGEKRTSRFRPVANIAKLPELLPKTKLSASLKIFRRQRRSIRRPTAA
jgi:hypothetical protein